MNHCAFHPDRETGLSCSACGTPICGECVRPTPVGQRCPNCAREKTRVTNLAATTNQPIVTITLIALNVIAFVAASLAGGGFASGGRGDLMTNGQLYGPAVAYNHEYWRIVTSGFLHAGFFHLLMNMIFIWILGNMLEPAIGRAKFATLYFVSLLCGSMGALVLQPMVPVVGASGAAFGLLGAAIVLAKRRGMNIWESGLGPVLAINLVITFLVPGIAIGAHLGGVAGGFAAGFILEEVGDRHGKAAAIGACCVLGIVALAVGISAASGSGLIHGSSGL